jgi:hypothetical protein
MITKGTKYNVQYKSSKAFHNVLVFFTTIHSRQGQERDFFFLSSPPRPDQFRGLSSLLPSGYRGSGVRLTTHLHLVPRLEGVELYLHSPNTSSRHGG